MTTATGTITTIAGTGAAGYSGDGGAATSATIKFPAGLNVDSDSNVYFGDNQGYNVIRKVTVSTGVISTVAGTGSTSASYNGDNMAATSANLYNPYDIVLDGYGNVYIADSSDNRIRKVTVSTGMISTIVGTGAASSTGDGAAATAATINQPRFIRFDSFGNLYISDNSGNRVRKVTIASTLAAQSVSPSEVPSVSPTPVPSYAPTTAPTPSTSVGPSMPSINPTEYPSYEPTATEFPSSQPSTYPSSSPTKVQLLLLDGFSASWSNDYVKTKAQFYLASYIAFFCGIFFILCALDYFHVMKGPLQRLLETAFVSSLYKKCLLQSTKGQAVLSGLYALDEDIKKLLKASEQQPESSEIEVIDMDSDLRKMETVSSKRSVLHLLKSSKKLTFNRAYHKYLQQSRAYLGCDKTILFPNGLHFTLWSCKILRLEPGLVEDFVLHVCANHSFISCFMAPSGSDYSRSGRRLVYMMQNITAFFISAFTSSLFNFCGLGVLFSNAFDVLVISPVSLKLGDFTKYLYTLKYSVDVIRSDAPSGAWGVLIAQSLVYFSRFIVFFMIVCGLVLLFLSALFTFSTNRDGIITQFLWQVLLVAVLYELIVSCLLFVSSYYYSLSLVCLGYDISLLQIGTRYLEYLVKNDLQINRDYVVIHRLHGWFQVHYVVSKQYAVMKGLHNTQGVPNDRETITVSPIGVNPMYALSHTATDTRDATSIIDDDDYMANGRFSDNAQATMERSSVKSVNKSKFLSVFSPKNIAGLYQTKSNEMKAPSNLASRCSISIDDQVLFQEFQKENPNDANCANNEELFEEWKCKRKFKDNTRISFIKTFEYFERGAQT